MTETSATPLGRLRLRTAPPLVPLLVGAILLLSLVGCLSTDVAVSNGNAGEKGGAFRVAVYADAKAIDEGKPDPPPTLIELFRVEKGKEIFLQRSLASRWGVDGLPAGDYRMKVVAVLDAGGNIQDPRSGDRETNFTIRDGEAAQVQVVLKKAPVGLIVVLAITVILVAVAVVLIAREGDLPTPPLPTELLANLPPPPPLDHVVFWGEFGASFPVDAFDGMPGEPVNRLPPRVTSTFPVHGALVSARRISPSVTFSQPIDTKKIGPKTIRMLGSKSGLFTGRTSIRQGLLRFEPDVDLQPKEVVTVTVVGEEIESPGGPAMEKDFSWSFRVAP